MQALKLTVAELLAPSASVFKFPELTHPQLAFYAVRSHGLVRGTLQQLVIADQSQWLGFLMHGVSTRSVSTVSPYRHLNCGEVTELRGPSILIKSDGEYFRGAMMR